MSVVKYANAYFTDRLYGGPEEGGWWYDTGEPIMSLPFICGDEKETDEDGNTHTSYDNLARNLAFEQVWKLCEAAGLNPPDMAYLFKRDWMIDGFAIHIEDKPGESYPQERPHYE